MVKPRTMPGVLELLPPEQITFQTMLDTIRRVFELFGFLPIETPAIEVAEILLTKTGGETERQVYLTQSTGSRQQGADPDLALRFDLTVPLARYVAEHQQDLAFPFRRYQMQRVYRGESAQRGRFREFYQCDIDVIGRDQLSLRYDAEMPAVIERVFDELEIGPFTIRINNRKLMRGILEAVGIDDVDTQVAVLREIDKLDKRGANSVKAALGELGLQPGTSDQLLEIVAGPTGQGAPAEVLARLASMPNAGPTLAAGVDELTTVFETMHNLGVSDDRYRLDVSVARGLDYYTGTVYETTLDDHPEVGSICSGGRYDDLAGRYTSSALPGVGISIGLTRLFWQLREAGIVGASPSVVSVLVTLMDDDGTVYSLDLASRLRQAGINTEVVVEPSRLGKQLKYAARAGIRFAVIAGDDERQRHSVTIRDLREQTQEEVSTDVIVAYLLDRQE